MASFRRTLSPYNDRIHQNGTHNVACFDQSPRKSVRFPRFTSLILPGKFPRKYHLSWKKSLTRCLLSFFIGFLLGLTPFGQVDDLQIQSHNSHDLGVMEIMPPRINAVLDGDRINRHEDGLSVRAVNLGFQEGGETDVVQKLVNFVDPHLMSPRKQLIVITPTYNRALQAYFLNRLGQVLRLVKPPLLWIVVESNAASVETAELLRKTGVMYRHLVCKQNTTDVKDRGVYQRNTALEHIERHKLDGIVYFADDDNMYSLELFESLREIRRFGTWPVAMLSQGKNKAILEGPVCNGSQVIGWHTNEKSSRLRRFHVDMSGFAFNSTILWDPKRWRSPYLNPVRQLDTIKEGFQETTFIAQVVEDESQMEGIPPGCTRIMNWHLHTDARSPSYPKGWMLQKNLNAILPIK